MSKPKEAEAVVAETTSENVWDQVVEAEPAPEPAAAEPAPEKPAAEAAPEKPTIEKEPSAVSLEEIQSRLSTLENENTGLRRDLFRQRERNRVLKEQLKGGTQEGGSTEEVALDPDAAEVKDGKLVFKRGDLQDQLKRAGYQPPASEDDARTQAARYYDGLRSGFIERASDKEAARTAVEEFEQAYQWLDQRVGQALGELGIAPTDVKGLAGLMELVENEGIAKEFASKYEGMEIEDLVIAPNDPRLFSRSVSRYMERRRERASEGSEQGATRERVERAPSALRMPDRPRSFAAGGSTGRVGGQRLSAKQLSEIPPEDLFDLPDDVFAEMQRAGMAGTKPK